MRRHREQGRGLVFVIGVCQYLHINFAAEEIMKLIFTTNGSDLAARVDPSFGRAPNVRPHDPESAPLQVISNQQNLNAAQGAGIQAAQTIVKAGAGQLTEAPAANVEGHWA